MTNKFWFIFNIDQLKLQVNTLQCHNYCFLFNTKDYHLSSWMARDTWDGIRKLILRVISNKNNKNSQEFATNKLPVSLVFFAAKQSVSFFFWSNCSVSKVKELQGFTKQFSLNWAKNSLFGKIVEKISI